MTQENNTYPLGINKTDGSTSDFNGLNTIFEKLLKTKPAEVLLSEDLIAIHGAMFKKNYVWGGELSKNQSIFGGYVSAPTARMKLELKLADKQLSNMWKQVETKTEKMIMLAFQHVRYVSIHPFHDGNGRSTRSLLLNNVNRLFGDVRVLEWKKPHYIEVLNIARHDSNISPLTKFLSDMYNLKMDVPERITPDYKTYPNHDLPIKSIEEELKLSKLGNNSFKEHDVTKQEIRWLKDVGDRTPLTIENALTQVDRIHSAKKLISRNRVTKENITAKIKIIHAFINNETSSPKRFNTSFQDTLVSLVSKHPKSLNLVYNVLGLPFDSQAINNINKLNDSLSLVKSIIKSSPSPIKKIINNNTEKTDSNDR